MEITIDTATARAAQSPCSVGADRAKQRLIRTTSRISCQPAAGEAGALLIENSAIKRELALCNRRQRSLKRLWSLALEKGDAHKTAY